MSQIVIGVDGTDRDADVLALGARLVTAASARVIIAHAHPYGPLEGLLGEGEHARLLRELAEGIAARVAAHLPGADVTMELLADTSPARALNRLAGEHDTRMLVVGSSSQGRIGITGPGSVSERAAQGSACPVAVAPLGYAASAPERLATIGCAFDGEAPSRAALAVATRLAGDTGARLQLIAVFEPIAYGNLSVAPPLDLHTVNATLRSELGEELTRAAEEAGAEPVLLDGAPADQLAARSADLDLLVTGSRGYGPLRSVLLGGVSGRVIRTARCPVVVCPREPAGARPTDDHP